MSQSVNHLNAFFSEAFRQLAPNRLVPEIEVRFYPYAGINHKIRCRSKRIYVRISDIFKNAPVDVHRAIAFILVARFLSKRTPENHERVYRDYAYLPQVLQASDIARRRRGRKLISSAQGDVYDLDKIFRRLNRKYFDGEIEKPTLAWSQRRTRRIMGYHEVVHDAIIINKTLDAHNIPEWFVEYVLYHEMLHLKHPAKVIKGRRYHHTHAFLAEEEKFPDYQRAQLQLELIARQQRVPHTRAA